MDIPSTNMMTSYSQNCQPRNPCNDIPCKITCFLIKYGH